MSGRKQHYIPQSLLRGFGKQARGKAVQVAVYSRDRAVFTTATDGVAARRYFYSELAGDIGLGTLDDSITAFETPLAETFAEFRATAPGHTVEATKAAKAVTHLCVRQAHIRDSLASAAGDLLAGTSALFLDREWTRKALGLDARMPNPIFRDVIDEMYQKFGGQLAQLGVTKSSFEQFVFAKAKADFDRNFAGQSELLQAIFGQLQGQTERLARDGHIKALKQSLAPDARVEILRRFSWRVVPSPPCGFVLPDCVVLGWSVAGSYQPMIFAGKEVDTVFMPLCHDRLLVGERAGAAVRGPALANEVSAACSWDFFIARDRTAELQQLVPRIGERVRLLMNEGIRSALQEHGSAQSSS